jgi:hypothetical protein
LAWLGDSTSSERAPPSPLLSELQVPEWQELAKDRVKWRKMLKSIRIWR